MTVRHIKRFALCGGILMLAGCVSATNQARDVAGASEATNKLTLGAVQREIRVGMSGADVVAALGSPNMVTTDERRRETWVYDKVSSETIYSSSAGGVGILFVGAVSGRTGVTQTTQKTLTIVIRYDEASLVRDFSYRSSSF